MVYKGACVFNIPPGQYPPIHLPTGVFLPVMMKVESTDSETGEPEDLTMIPPGRFMEMVGGEKYFVSYVPAELVKG